MTLLTILLGGMFLPPVSAMGKEIPDLEKFQGEWIIYSIESLGRKIDGTKATTLSIKGHAWLMTIRGKETKKTFTINASESPPHFDLSTSVKDGTQLVHKGLYKFDGDSLTVCVPLYANGVRPTELEGGEGVEVFVFKRPVK